MVGLVGGIGRIGDGFFFGYQVLKDFTIFGVRNLLGGLILGDFGGTEVEIGDEALHGGKVVKEMLPDEV